MPCWSALLDAPLNDRSQLPACCACLRAEFPLHRNLLYGQFYVLLLVLIVAACWTYLRKYYVLAGALVAVAAACKIFPVLLFVFFLQRRSWRALASGVVTGLAAVAVSVAVFGWNLHRTYLHEILPWTLHGEGMPPYVTSSASISSVLHYLFLTEPQWNPHPWHYSPFWVFAVAAYVANVSAGALPCCSSARMTAREIGFCWSGRRC